MDVGGIVGFQGMRGRVLDERLQRLVGGEQVIAQQSRPMTITKVGLERAVFDFANPRPAAYGVVAVLLAILGGWLAAVSFRRT